MKILIVTNHSYMLYRFRTELIQKLMEEHEVVLSMPFVGHEEDFQAMGLRCIPTEVDRRGLNPIKDGKLLCAYHRILREEKPDLVVTYSIKPNIYAGLLCAMKGIPYCANVQGLGTAFQRKSLAWVATKLYKLALRKAKTVFFENQGNAREFLDRRILSESKITLLSGAGINLNQYTPVPYPGHDSVRFLYLSRIMKEKGIDELFAAMRRLYEKYGSRVQLDLVGFFDDDYEKQLEALAADGIAVFHGFQTDPRPFYANADCVVLPSYHEGMSNVLLEAAAMGRPLITSNIHGCKEAVIEGVNGLLCEPQDTDSLYEAMERFMELSREERIAMGKSGRQHMEAVFDKEKVVAETVAALGL